jgi:hypothetical protein
MKRPCPAAERWLAIFFGNRILDTEELPAADLISSVDRITRSPNEPPRV